MELQDKNTRNVVTLIPPLISIQYLPIQRNSSNKSHFLHYLQAILILIHLGLLLVHVCSLGVPLWFPLQALRAEPGFCESLLEISPEVSCTCNQFGAELHTGSGLDAAVLATF